jgi:hypothetical protein
MTKSTGARGDRIWALKGRPTVKSARYGGTPPVKNRGAGKGGRQRGVRWKRSLQIKTSNHAIK